MVLNTFEALGDRAPQSSSLHQADGVAMAFLQPGTTVTPFPFKHPNLLDTQIRIQVTHVGLCQSDILTSTLGWGPEVHFPLVPGHQMIGKVTSVGQKVSNIQPGTKVGFGTFRDCCSNCISCRECSSGKNQLCNFLQDTYNPHFGGYSTSFQAPANYFYHIPENLPGQAAPLFCAGATTFTPLRHYAHPGSKIGVAGIGGLGHMAILFARAMGCQVFAFSSNNEKEYQALELGAHHFVNTSDEDKVKENLRRLDFLMQTSPVYNMDFDSQFIRPDGIYCPVGDPAKDTQIEFNIGTFISKNIKIIPNLVGSKQDIVDMLEFCRLNQVLPRTEVYSFERTQEAVDILAKGVPRRPRFRAVVRPEGYFSPN